MRFIFIIVLFISNPLYANDIFDVWSIKYNLPDRLLKAICKVESSGLSIQVVNNDGGSASYGPCQVKLTTAQFIDNVYHIKNKVCSETLHIPNINIQYAAMYLKWQLKRYNDDFFEATIAYNMGSYFPGHGYKYISKVMSAMEE